MTELDAKQRIERGRRAGEAVNEFVNPAFEHAHETYLGRMKELVSREPWETGKITALVTAMRVLEVVHSDMAAIIHDGEVAKCDLARVEKVASIPEAKRKLLGL